jgi:hypothetical protein
MAGVDSGRRHVARWVDAFDKLTEALRSATDQQVHAAAEEKRQMNRYAVVKDDLEDTEEAWQAAERERESADNEVKAILTEMAALNTEAVSRMQLTVRPQDEEALEEDEAERDEAERLEAEARLALNPVELHAKMRASIERATQGAAA